MIMISIDKLHREIDSLNNEKLGGLIEYATEVYSERPEIKKEQAKEKLIEEIEEYICLILLSLASIAGAEASPTRTTPVPLMLKHEQTAKKSEYGSVIDLINSSSYDELEINLENRLSELLNELRMPNTKIDEVQLTAKIGVIKDLIERVKSDKEALSMKR